MTIAALSDALLRRGGPADLSLVAGLERRCFGVSDGAFSRRQLRELLANPRAYWLVSVDGLGASCWLLASNGVSRWGRLYSLAVDPKARGQGLGARLLDAGLAWAHAQRLPACRAEVKADNLAARRLYAKAGFREVAALADYYGPGLAGIRLEKRLGQPN